MTMSSDEVDAYQKRLSKQLEGCGGCTEVWSELSTQRNTYSQSAPEVTGPSFKDNLAVEKLGSSLEESIISDAKSSSEFSTLESRLSEEGYDTNIQKEGALRYEYTENGNNKKADVAAFYYKNTETDKLYTMVKSSGDFESYSVYCRLNSNQKLKSVEAYVLEKNYSTTQTNSIIEPLHGHVGGTYRGGHRIRDGQEARPISPNKPVTHECQCNQYDNGHKKFNCMDDIVTCDDCITKQTNIDNICNSGPQGDWAGPSQVGSAAVGAWSIANKHPYIGAINVGYSAYMGAKSTVCDWTDKNDTNRTPREICEDSNHCCGNSN
jgi:hypothetical protein